jgi:hypothetical protein
MKHLLKFLALISLLALTSCVAPSDVSPTTGNLLGPLVGGAAGGVVAAAASKSLVMPGIAGGAALGYYLTTLRGDAAGIMRAGGQVYVLGQFASIEIPADNLFESNTSEFLPGTENILASIVSILKRFPNNNIVISGNTSGFNTHKLEHKLSEDRAREVAAFCWMHGVISFGEHSSKIDRELVYTGSGSYSPISRDYPVAALRSNSRIQITSFPTRVSLHLDKTHKTFNNIGASEAPNFHEKNASNVDRAFNMDDLPAAPNQFANDSEVETNITSGKDDSGIVPSSQDNETNFDTKTSDFGSTFENYKSLDKASHTLEGERVAKHAPYKGEDAFSSRSDLKGDSPR